MLKFFAIEVWNEFSITKTQHLCDAFSVQFGLRLFDVRNSPTADHLDQLWS